MAGPVLRIIVAHQIVDVRELPGDTTLGRAADNDVVLPDPAVSNHHARIECVAGRWRLVDLGSANGTCVAAGPVLRAGQAFVLDEETQVKLGNTIVEFRPAEVAPAGGRHAALAWGAPDGTARAGQAGAGPGVDRGVARGGDGATGAPTSDPLAGLHRPAPSRRPSPREPEPEAALPPAPPGASGALPPPRPKSVPQGPAPGPLAAEAARERPATPASAPSRVSTVASASASFAEAGCAEDGGDAIPAPAPGGRHRDPATLHPRMLVVGEAGVTTVALPPRRALIGRDAGCDLRLDHPSISGRHAELLWDGGGWTIRDLGSTNSTRVGLVRVEESARLPNGSHLILGSLDLLFVHDGPFEGPEGAPVDGPGLLAWLAARGRIGRSQARQVRAAADRSGASVEELLVSQGLLTPGALTELRHNAGRTLLGHSDSGTWRRTPLRALILLAALLAAAILALVFF